MPLSIQKIKKGILELETMYIDKHYPFEMIPLKYPLTSFSDFLDFQTLSIHYNQIYKGYIDELNKNGYKINLECKG